MLGVPQVPLSIGTRRAISNVMNLAEEKVSKFRFGLFSIFKVLIEHFQYCVDTIDFSCCFPESAKL